KCNSATQIYVLRFFIGLAESAFYPGMQYVIGSWYRKDELAKRSCIFHASGNIGNMFSGYLMAAAYNLNGLTGFHGWQWLFIINTNGVSYGGQPAFALWLKSEGYSVAAVNSFPTIASAIGVVFTLLYAWTSDSLFRGARWPAMVFAGCFNIVTNSSLAVWYI